MQDTFQWTTELVNEYAGTFLLQAMKAIEAARNGSTVEKIISASEFIASKAPKKEWEIVAYSFEPLKGIDKPVLVTQGSKYWESAMSGDKDFLIHSVRRLSDNTTWQEDETVEVWERGRQVIKGFEVSGAQILAQTDKGTFLLNALQKLPQPILVTHDGVEVELKDGNKVWVTDSVTFKEDSLTFTDRVNIDKVKEVRPNYLFFSTEESRDKWLMENRPLLSLNDVKEVFNKWFRGSSEKDLITHFTIVVKQKLNQ